MDVVHSYLQEMAIENGNFFYYKASEFLDERFGNTFSIRRPEVVINLATLYAINAAVASKTCPSHEGN